MNSRLAFSLLISNFQFSSAAIFSPIGELDRRMAAYMVLAGKITFPDRDLDLWLLIIVIRIFAKGQLVPKSSSDTQTHKPTATVPTAQTATEVVVSKQNLLLGRCRSVQLPGIHGYCWILKMLRRWLFGRMRDGPSFQETSFRLFDVCPHDLPTSLFSQHLPCISGW